MTFIFGILAGLVMPCQTSINTRLRKALNSPFRASCVNFLVGLTFIVLISFVLGDGPFCLSALSGVPWWLCLGGLCGVMVLTSNLLLFPVLGSVQTVIFPVFGQISMGVLIDTFGWMGTTVIPLTLWRVFGVLIVLAGVLLVATGGTKAEKSGTDKSPATLWLYRGFGFFVGVLGAIQATINGRLATLWDSNVQSAMMNFVVGSLALIALCLITRPRFPKPQTDGPKWMWFGGLLGGAFVIFNAFLQRELGTGMTLILNFLGLASGGLIIDQTGILDSPKRKVTLQKILGVIVMLGGAAMIRLL